MEITKADLKKTGNWLQYYITCDKCSTDVYWDGNLKPNFCSKCGEKFEYDFKKVI